MTSLCSLLHVFDIPDAQHSPRELNEAELPLSLWVCSVNRLAIHTGLLPSREGAFHVDLLSMRLLESKCFPQVRALECERGRCGANRARSRACRRGWTGSGSIAIVGCWIFEWLKGRKGTKRLCSPVHLAIGVGLRADAAIHRRRGDHALRTWSCLSGVIRIESVRAGRRRRYASSIATSHRCSWSRSGSWREGSAEWRGRRERLR